MNEFEEDGEQVGLDPDNGARCRNFDYFFTMSS